MCTKTWKTCAQNLQISSGGAARQKRKKRKGEKKGKRISSGVNLSRIVKYRISDVCLMYMPLANKRGTEVCAWVVQDLSISAMFMESHTYAQFVFLSRFPKSMYFYIAGGS